MKFVTEKPSKERTFFVGKHGEWQSFNIDSEDYEYVDFEKSLLGYKDDGDPSDTVYVMARLSFNTEDESAYIVIYKNVPSGDHVTLLEMPVTLEAALTMVGAEELT